MRPTLIALFLISAAGLAAAQPAPANPTPAPAPGTGSGAPPPTEPAPPPEPTGPVTMPEHPAEPPPTAPVAEEKPAVKATYDNGLKFESDDDNYELKLLFRNQLRFESTRPLEGNQFLNTFYIPRSRLQAEGYVFGKDTRYKLEFGLGDAGSFAFVKDLYIDKKLADAPVWLRLGQWKRPFNRAEMVSDFASTFNERSIQNELAGGGRSLGVGVHNDYEKSPEGLEWFAGVFNTFSGGSDRPAQATTCAADATGAIKCTTTRPSNFPTDFGPALVLRAGWNSAKIKGYSESDLEGGPLRYGVGLSYKVDLANFTDGTKDSWAQNMSHGVEADAMIKVEGFAVDTGVVMMKIKDADPLYGVFAQPGLFLVPKHDEVTLRGAYTTGDATEPDRGNIELRAAYTHFFHGHTFKFASDVGMLQKLGKDMAGEKDKPDLQARLMLQLSI